MHIKGLKAALAVLMVCAGAAWAQGRAGEAPGSTATAADKKAGPKKVELPKGWRDWTHVKSMLIHSEKHPLFEAFGGIHHVYANDKALKALKANKGAYPDGSIFVFDLLNAPESGGAYTEGPRKVTAVMVKDKKKYAETDGWGWQAWAGGDPQKPVLADLDSQKACASCHKQVASRGGVFSEWRQ